MRTRGRERRLRRDGRGVASTIGTIMALMVFLSVLAMFTNQWIPVYMTESEAKHVTEILLAMTQFKTNVDFQILAYRVAQMTNYTSYAAPTLVNAFKLGASGIPVFAADTMGQLSMRTRGEGIHVAPFGNASAGTAFKGRYANGSVDMYMPNRYYIEERIIYENGAILVEQPDGVFVRDGPQFDVRKSGGRLNLTVTLVHVFGKDRAVSGVGPASVNSRLLWVESDVYRNMDDAVLFTLSTEYAEAWNAYFQQYLKGAGLAASDYTLAYDETGGTVSLGFNNVRNLDLTTARLDIAIGGFGE